MVRTRKSIYELQDAYDQAAPKDKGSTDLVKLIVAFQALQNTNRKDDPSFFQIAGLHGAPFRGAGWGNSQWWGGYCNHGNILFPTWHRAYLLELEKALDKHGLGPSIGLPYWDQLDSRASSEGLPHIFTDKTVDVGEPERIPNPLRSFTLPNYISDNATPAPANYKKPIGYTTVRYPYSGLVGTEKDRDQTERQKVYVESLGNTDDLLNDNIKYWLTLTGPGSQGIAAQYNSCLNAPNYTLFSNTTSATEYNEPEKGRRSFTPVVSIESPHNGMHLAIGGIDIPGFEHGVVKGANGDMGENNTAGFDPIFFFHHAFIDKLFWDWQSGHDQTTQLKIEEEYVRYPGTNSVDNQGPTPGVPGNAWLTLDSPLEPFINPETHRVYTSKDVVDIANLGYSYENPVPPIEGPTPPREGNPKAIVPHTSQFERPFPPLAAGVIRISGVNRSNFRGSFAVVVQVKVKYQDDTEEWIVVDVEGILSRWNIAGCANCQTHLNVTTFTKLPQGVFSKQFLAEKRDAGELEKYISVSVRHHEDDEDSVRRRPPAIDPPDYAPNPGHFKGILEYHRDWDLVLDDDSDDEEHVDSDDEEHVDSDDEEHLDLGDEDPLSDNYALPPDNANLSPRVRVVPDDADIILGGGRI